MLNEALVSNQAWQTTVEIYVHCLKEWDVISGISLAFIMPLLVGSDRRV